MSADLPGGWDRVLASPAAPAILRLPIELEGYLTGVIVAPDVILPSAWIEGLWDDEPNFDDLDETKLVVAGIMEYYNGLIERIDDEGEVFQPLYMDQSGTPDLDEAIAWVRGFWNAIRLAPDAWQALGEDERTAMLVGPFASFLDLDRIPGIEVPGDLDRCAGRTPNSSRRFFPPCACSPRWVGSARQRRDVLRKLDATSPAPAAQARNTKRCCGA
jgi:uncharacterized protein